MGPNALRQVSVAEFNDIKSVLVSAKALLAEVVAKKPELDCQTKETPAPKDSKDWWGPRLRAVHEGSKSDC